MSANEFQGVLGQRVGEVPTVALVLPTVYVKVVIVIVRVATTKANKLLEPPSVGMEAGIKSAVVPFSDQACAVPSCGKDIADCPFAERDSIKPAPLQGVDRASAMRVLACQQARTRRSVAAGLGLTCPVTRRQGAWHR